MESIIHGIGEDPTVVGYVIISPDGIPIKHHSKMSYSTAILYSGLVSDFHARAKNALQRLELSASDSELHHFRLRTRLGTEIIVTSKSDYLLAVVQNCTGKPWVWGDEENEVSN